MSAALLSRDDASIALDLTVNGRPRRMRAEPRTHLADLLREGLDLTGTHLGCEHGVCGACTVLLDGEPARSCLTFAGSCDGLSVTTIEGLDDDEIATELRAAFNREHALQCGFCTPGMLVTARDLVLRLPEADERRVRLGLAGNLCRCTGYVGIVRAILSVIRERRGRGIEPLVAERVLGPVGAGLDSVMLRRREAPVSQSLAAYTQDPHPEVRSEAKPRRTHDVGACFEAGLQPAPQHEDVGKSHLLPIPQDDERGAGKDEAAFDFEPANTFEQTFTVPFPPDAVFALFGRVEEVAACLPGARVTTMLSPDRVEGEIRVTLGPISAAFRGNARIGRNEAARSGRIVGAGEDRGGRSSTQGAIDYRVLPGQDPGSAIVQLTVGYTLKGALAQFSRPGLVRDLAGRITAEFARNIEARLGGRDAPSGASGLDTGSLLAGLVRGWFSRLFARFRPRG